MIVVVIKTWKTNRRHNSGIQFDLVQDLVHHICLFGRKMNHAISFFVQLSPHNLIRTNYYWEFLLILSGVKLGCLRQKSPSVLQTPSPDTSASINTSDSLMFEVIVVKAVFCKQHCTAFIYLWCIQRDGQSLHTIHFQTDKNIIDSASGVVLSLCQLPRHPIWQLIPDDVILAGFYLRHLVYLIRKSHPLTTTSLSI